MLDKFGNNVLSELLLKDEVYTIALIDRGGNIVAHKDTSQIMGYNLKQADEANFNNLFNSGSGQCYKYKGCY